MTHKVSFALEDNNIIETVLMRTSRRNTICVSTQAGCAIGCVFCASGQMGYKRNLSVGEIVEQVYYFARRLQGLSKELLTLYLWEWVNLFIIFLL